MFVIERDIFLQVFYYAIVTKYFKIYWNIVSFIHEQGKLLDYIFYKLKIFFFARIVNALVGIGIS